MNAKEFYNSLVSLVSNQLKQNDSAHDLSHSKRVLSVALEISKENGEIDEIVLIASSLLHDICEKVIKESKPKISFKKAKTILENYSQFLNLDQIKKIKDSIVNHSFSVGKIPQTLEGKILQDSDRIDALGASGIARVFAICGERKSSFYHDQDPFCENGRSLDDKNYTVDHFYTKLFKLKDTLHTEKAKEIAEKRIQFMKQYLDQFRSEISLNIEEKI
ncbi:putative superfamily hydrolase [Anaeramoeba ignava]|uniref:Superfamily hydrolase n=1 Tax=Anaeramoeba ignava TaxID=1746090 RepID=A0A9Q0LLK9_ANAIG|nr:putative superfamily hydrolase [Anaeramoeba ignava]|eukprot:Anaeramoba_ignava/a240093_5.p1 GENE.a240093_5~~a240093_5.p1  ORF type:complete len:219 (+),score=90.35 a240093_5:2-658(+)